MSDKHPNTPPKVKPRLRSAPRIKQLFWCDFPKDAHLPEFWKTRPVIILSKSHVLTGVATVIPCTTSDQMGSKWAVKLRTSIDGQDSWAICDKPTTVAVSRLSPFKKANTRVSDEEFSEILECVAKWLPLQMVEKP